MDELPTDHYADVPYPLLREALEAFFADPIAAEQALEKGPEGWGDLAAEARERALDAILGNVKLREARERL